MIGDGTARIPARKLSGADEVAYLDRLAAVLRAARLNLQFPDVRRLLDHLWVLRPEAHRGLYDGVEVDLRTGLPHYKEWTRAQTDVRLAAKMIEQLGDRRELERASAKGELHEKQLTKHHYYSDIRARKLAELGGMQVALRRVENATRTAFFHIVFDKLDARGLFVRYSIDLSQQSSVWAERVVELDAADTAAHTEVFQALIYKLTALDAELVFIKLAELGGLTVESVVKGTIGPIFFGGINPPPPPLADLVVEKNDLLATFALAIAAIDLSESRENDPFPEARPELWPERNEVRSYKVFRDRKFVVARGREAPVHAACEARGTRNIVYAV